MTQGNKDYYRPCYIIGMGIVSPLGTHLEENLRAIERGVSGIGPVSLFPVPANRNFPVGEVKVLTDISSSMPRTHQLARMAAMQAVEGHDVIPDAIVLGVCTGGMPTTEELIRDNESDYHEYRYHSVGSVAEDIASLLRCKGPAITVSTACSSGSAAIALGMAMIRSGMARTVLAGGADALCRLTYHGFASLKLVDPEGAKPFDVNRQGMSVSEGAAMVLISSEATGDSRIQMMGAGLSCDAYHPVAPDPKGRGAVSAMKAALRNAGIGTSEIDYINFHGTGTIENDRSEARAVNILFPSRPRYMSSIKGAFGHSLGASGAIEAVICAACIEAGLVPGNTGCVSPDPALELRPTLKPVRSSVSKVISNSFGFGGNNASLVIGLSEKKGKRIAAKSMHRFRVLGRACITEAGDTEHTFKNLLERKPFKGVLLDDSIGTYLSSRSVRRLKVMPKLAMTIGLMASSEKGISPFSVFMGTGWGSVSETYDFLTRLFETKEQFPSPTDFSSSVHNAPAGHLSILTHAHGPNITTSGGDYSFEQALLSAGLMAGDEPCLVIGADEAHPVLSPLFDSSVAQAQTLSGGGGGLLLVRSWDEEKETGITLTGKHGPLERGGMKGPSCSHISIALAFYENVEHNRDVILSLLDSIGVSGEISSRYGALFAGIPLAFRDEALRQLDEFMASTGFDGPVIDYREFTGQFASASAVASVMAVRLVEHGSIPASLTGDRDVSLKGRGILVLGLGRFITALEVYRT